MRRILIALIVAVGAFAFTQSANASHFRGAALVPSVDANGVLTVTETSFWRPTFVAQLTVPTVSGASYQSSSAVATDVSDSRFTIVSRTHTYQLNSGAGNYDITSSSCCRVSGIQNATGNSATSWSMDSAIYWDGQNANTPINFLFNAIQPEVVRGVDYNDNVGASAGNAGTISYVQQINSDGGGTWTEVTDFTINANTGAMFIPASTTSALADNPTNEGADYIFGGIINNSDGSFVEFDWLFDAVNTGPAQNLAPDVTDHTINAVVGQTINQTVTGTDPDSGDDVTLSFLSNSGPTVNLPFTFTPAAAGNPTTGTFTWDTTGSPLGTYTFNIRGSDGSLTDIGQITVNLTAGNLVPTPTAAFVGLPILAAGLLRRRRA